MKTTDIMTNEIPIYSSERNFKNIWQKYSVYSDKLVLKTLLRAITIQFDDFEKVEIHPPNIKIIFTTNWFSQKFTPALKLDLSDLCEHLAIYNKSGFFKIYLITPDNLSMFKNYLERAVEKFRLAKASQSAKQ